MAGRAPVPSPDISDRTFEHIRDAVYSFSGVYLAPARKARFAEQLWPRLRYHRFDSFDEYTRLLTGGPSRENELRAVVQLLAQQEGGFRCDSPQIQALVRSVLPRLARDGRGSAAEPVLVWCAACATGEEAYSVAIALAEACPGDLRWQVTASDESDEALRRCEAGLYGAPSLRGLPAAVVERWFTRVGAHYAVKDVIRSRVRFLRINLRDPDEVTALGGLHVVFCRNALAGVDPESKRRIVAAIYRTLAPGGFLFLGDRESLNGSAGALKLAILRASIAYWKPC